MQTNYTGNGLRMLLKLTFKADVLVADGVHEQTIEIMSAVFEMCVGVAGVVNIED